jgi:hypothetical protein
LVIGLLVAKRITVVPHSNPVEQLSVTLAETVKSGVTIGRHAVHVTPQMLTIDLLLARRPIILQPNKPRLCCVRGKKDAAIVKRRRSKACVVV